MVKSMTVSDPPTAQQFYHGTKADLKPADLIAPGDTSNYRRRKAAAYVYLTATPWTPPCGVRSCPD
jgi:hypothetical protein